MGLALGWVGGVARVGVLGVAVLVVVVVSWGWGLGFGGGGEDAVDVGLFEIMCWRLRLWVLWVGKGAVEK